MLAMATRNNSQDEANATRMSCHDGRLAYTRHASAETQTTSATFTSGGACSRQMSSTSAQGSSTIGARPMNRLLYQRTFRQLTEPST